MSKKEQIIQLFQTAKSGKTAVASIFMPDLTTWYAWHSKNNTLPEEFTGKKLEDVYRSLGVPIWNTCKPWVIESENVKVSHKQHREEKITTYKFRENTLTARWIKGPDGDWWQSEYPVKQAEDLNVIRAYLEGRVFRVETEKLEKMLNLTGNDGIVAAQLPSRAFSWLMLEMLGWSDGLMILLDEEEIISELVTLAESQLQSFTSTLIAELQKKDCRIYLSPDNLDGMFISPEYFDQYLKNGYEITSKICHENNSFLIVHGGGPLGGILEKISQSGIDCVTGISGPPQGNTPIETARNIVKNQIVLWGGIPQDYLIDTAESENFKLKIENIIENYKNDNQSIIGIADHVPLYADISRLKLIVDHVNS